MTIRKALIPCSVVLTLMIPQTGWTNLRAPRTWNQLGVAASPRASAVSVGIGGLRTTFSSDLRLSETALSYDGKVLSASTGSATITARIDPIELVQGVVIVQKTADSEFEVSADAGLAMYIEEALRDTSLGDGFSIADLDFSLFAYDRRPLPRGAPRHPYVQARSLLGSDASYTGLTDDWQVPPTSWPQIFIRFAPLAENHVELQFNPQLLFHDRAGNTVETSPATSAIAERPYRAMVEDVAARPATYLKRSPALAHAAELTIALGLLRAGCSREGSCAALVEAAIGHGDEAVLDKQIAALHKKYTAIARSYQQASKRKSPSERAFVKKWRQQASAKRAFVLGADSWDDVFDQIHNAASALGEPKTLAAARKNLRQMEPQFDLVIPEDALLYAAYAVIDANRGEAQRAQESLSRAIALSSDYPLDRVIVARLGVAAATLLAIDKHESGFRLAFDMVRHIEKAQVAAYDEIEALIKPCVQRPTSCKSTEVRTWESEINNAGLAQGIATRDVPYLRGRIDYVVGILEPKGAKDRRRFLEGRIRVASPDHRDELVRLEHQLRATVAAHG